MMVPPVVYHDVAITAVTRFWRYVSPCKTVPLCVSSVRFGVTQTKLAGFELLMALITSGSPGEVVVRPASAQAPAVACHLSIYAHGSWLTSLFPVSLLSMEHPSPRRSSANHFALIPAANSWLPRLSPLQSHELPIDGLQSPAPARPLFWPLTMPT